jgi:radical SAM protein with 4Fe4S-binding SPASM domain
MYPHLPQLIVDARAIGYEFVEVFTNGTLLDTPLGERLLETFQEYRVNLAFSVYASRAKTHEIVTQQRGSFDRTIAGIRRAIDCNLPVRVGIITMKVNASELEETKIFLQKLGVKQIGIDRVRGIGRGSSLSQSNSLLDELCGSCWRGKLCINPKGQVFPCVFSWFYQVGNISKGIEVILKGERLRKFRHRIRKRQANYFPDYMDEGCQPTAPCPPDCYPSCIPCIPDCGPYNPPPKTKRIKK